MQQEGSAQLALRDSLITEPEGSQSRDEASMRGEMEGRGVSAKRRHPWEMVFCYAMSGVMISFVYGQFSILFYKYYTDISKEELNKLTFTAFMVEGAGEFCGGLVIALFSKRVKSVGLLFALNSLAFLGSVGLVSLGFAE